MRRERDWNQTQAFEALREKLELGPKSRSAYINLENGRPIKAKEERALIEYFGRGPDDEPAPATETPDLAAALVSLTEELSAMRREREAWERGVVEVLRSYEGGQVPAGLLDALVPQPREGARP